MPDSRTRPPRPCCRRWAPSSSTRARCCSARATAEDRLYVVVSGKIKLGRSGSAGRENLLAVLGPGQMFGELSLFDPGPRSTTATAVTACEIRTLEHDELMGWLAGRPEVAQGLLGQLAARLRRANDVVADLVFSDVPGRVAKQLLELARRVRRPPRRRHPRAPRPDPGGARPAGRRLPRDGEQGPGRLRRPRLDPTRTPLGHHPGRRARGAPRPLTQLTATPRCLRHRNDRGAPQSPGCAAVAVGEATIRRTRGSPSRSAGLAVAGVGDLHAGARGVEAGGGDQAVGGGGRRSR